MQHSKLTGDRYSILCAVYSKLVFQLLYFLFLSFPSWILDSAVNWTVLNAEPDSRGWTVADRCESDEGGIVLKVQIGNDELNLNQMALHRQISGRYGRTMPEEPDLGIVDYSLLN